MSDNTTPIEPFFELQRETITQTVSMLTGPRRLGRSMAEDGAEASERAPEQTLELSRQTLHRLLGASEGLSPSGEANEELHDSIDEAFDRLTDHQTSTFETFEALGQSADEQIGARTVAQAALLLRFNESLEQQTVTTAEQFEERILQGDDLTAELECAIDQFAEALESGALGIDDLESGLGPGAIEIPVGEEESPDEGSPDAAGVPADEVRCRVCGDTFGAITYSHLQTHDMSVDEYVEEFGEETPLRPEDR